MRSRCVRTTALALGLVVAAFAGVRAADAVKLKPLGSIYLDGRGEGLGEPEDVACAGGTIAIADTANHRVLTFVEGEDGLVFESEIVPAGIEAPIRVGFLSGGDLLVLDGRSRRISRVSRAGELRGVLEPAVEDGGRVVPRSFTVGAADRVFVLDVAGSRILGVDPAGTVERTVRIPTEAGFLSDVAVDPLGTVFAVSSTRPRVWVAGPSDETLTALTPSLADDVDFPTAIAIDPDGRLFLADSHGGGVLILDRDGSFRGRQVPMGWREGFARYPGGVCVDGGNRLFLAERGNSRVQMFEIR